MTKPVTRKMVVDCLLSLAVQHLQRPFHCYLCHEPLVSEQEIQFDHVHADVFDGPHEYQNLRPVHAACHKGKTKRDVQAKSKVDRILGLTCTGPKKKIQSRGFQKRPEGHEYKWGKQSFGRSPQPTHQKGK